MRAQLIELTVPRRWPRLKARSLDTALTMSWQSSNTPCTAMLWMFGSCSENIWARWNALMRPCGDSMNTATPRLPRIAYSAAPPVSPEVAPRMLSVVPRWVSTYSNSWPSSCMAMSLKASVGPSDSPSSDRPSFSGRSGTMSSLLKICEV